MPTPEIDSRYMRLDVVRALTAMMVMAYHFVASDTWDMAPASAFFLNGYRGVLIFFVLSGFLVFRPFVAGRVATGGYVIRRVARVMPAYIIALVGITVISGEHTFTDHPAQFLLLLQNYDPALFQAFMPTAWTLVLEMTFYLVLPIVAVAFLPVVRGRLPRGLTLLVAIGVVSLMAHVSPASPETPGAGALSFPAMIWAFIPGMAMAMVTVERPDLARRLANGYVALLGALLMAIGWMVGETPLLYMVADVCLVLGIGLLIPWLTRPRTAPESRPIRHLAWFGVVVSYPFYLWHMSVMSSVTGAGIGGPLAFVITFGLVVLIGVASYRLVERPAMRWAHTGTVPWRRRPVTAEPAPAAATVLAPPTNEPQLA
jgi:peptidoglycan/LPS O-acetylase OafA/YrhL